MIIQPGLLYLTRSEWGANTGIPRLGYTVARSNRTKAIIHHTVIVDNDATRNLWTDLDEVKAKMRQLQTIRPDLGMDVPYNFVMFLMEDGSVIVCEGRGLDRTGAHTKGHNTDGMATALQGNFMLPINLSPFVPAMSRWWGWLRYDMKMVNLGSKHPVGRIAFGHIDLSPTACPGDNLYTIIPQLTFREDDMALTPEEEQAVRHLIAEHKPGGNHHDALTDLFGRVDGLAELAAALDAEHKSGGNHFEALDDLFKRVAQHQEGHGSGGRTLEEIAAGLKVVTK